MSDHTFYSTANHHNERELTIVNAALLVGKAPTKEKRVRIKVRMILSATVNMGSPEWLDRAYAFVASSHDTVTPNIDFKGYDLHFSSENLFDNEGVKAPKCQMRSFEIHECGDSENPDVAASFVIYAPFSTAFWAWLGQYGGESCWCAFTPGVAMESEAPESDDEDEEDESPESDDGDDEEDAPQPQLQPVPNPVITLPSGGGAKTGKELAEYHMDMLEKENTKRGPGRPKKVDPPKFHVVQQPF